MELQQEVLKVTHCYFNSLQNLRVISAKEQDSVVITLNVCTYRVFTGLTERCRITLTSIELTCLYHGEVYHLCVVA